MHFCSNDTFVASLKGRHMIDSLGRTKMGENIEHILKRIIEAYTKMWSKYCFYFDILFPCISKLN